MKGLKYLKTKENNTNFRYPTLSRECFFFHPWTQYYTTTLHVQFILFFLSTRRRGINDLIPSKSKKKNTCRVDVPETKSEIIPFHVVRTVIDHWILRSNWDPLSSSPPNMYIYVHSHDSFWILCHRFPLHSRFPKTTRLPLFCPPQILLNYYHHSWLLLPPWMVLLGHSYSFDSTNMTLKKTPRSSWNLIYSLSALFWKISDNLNVLVASHTAIRN